MVNPKSYVFVQLDLSIVANTGICLFCKDSDCCLHDIHKIIILSVVLYECEIWSLTLR